MKRYSLTHLSDHTLLHDLAALASQDRRTTAELLAHIAEVDARKLYLPAAYPSMFAYCVGELRLSEDSAAKRIQAARAARKYPAIYEALAEGRLHLSAVGLLAPHLTAGTAEGLLTAATHKSKSEIEQMLAERYPRPDVAARVEAIESPSHHGAHGQLSPGIVAQPIEHAPGHVGNGFEHAPGHVGMQQAPASVQAHARVTPLSPQAFSVQFTMSRDMHDKLRYAQALLSHQLPSGNVAEVLDRALDALINQLEKRKFAATERPRVIRRKGPARARHLPAHVRRAVWERDGGRCTFVSESGRRCEARKLLEFDHMDEVARGGEATVGRMRLRCRAHNQYSAERAFGAEFMRQKREHAAESRAAAQARAAAKARETTRGHMAAESRAVADSLEPAQAQATAHARAAQAARDRATAERAREQDVIPWLRQLGFSIAEARRAAAHCEHIPDAPLEERVRAALSCFKPRSNARSRVVGA